MNALAEQSITAEAIRSIFSIFVQSEGKIKPHSIITGKSGTGKSFIVSSLAQEFQLNIINVNAAQITKEGISGNSLSKVLTPLRDAMGKPTIVFVDEFDKWFINSTGNRDAESVSMQNEFLKLLEGSTTEVFGDYGKYVSVSLENVLFVFAGAFNGETITSLSQLAKLGVRNEFLGRASLVFHTPELSVDSLKSFLDSSKLLVEYDLHFPGKKRKAVKDIKAVIEREHKQNVLGVRWIDSLIHRYYLNQTI